MKKRMYLVPSLILSSILSPISASAVTTFDTPASGSIWETSASSSATWSQITDPNGALMAFDVSTGTTQTFDVEISATSSGTAVNFTSGTCSANINLSGGLTLTLSTHQRTSTSITCRFVASNWTTGTGYTIPLKIDNTDPANLGDGYGQIRVGFQNNQSNLSNQNQNQISNNNSQSSQNVSSRAVKYSGPELSNPSPLTSKGGVVKTTGKKLSDISSVKINGASIGFKASSDSELELTIPANLSPGRYDLEITSSYGRLIQIGAVTVKAPTQAASLSLKGSGSRVDAYMLTELSNIGSMFNADYKKITCVVNAADAATAQAVADKVCKSLKAGELRSAATKSVAKSTFKGEGYWVRVYLAG